MLPPDDLLRTARLMEEFSKSFADLGKPFRDMSERIAQQWGQLARIEKVMEPFRHVQMEPFLQVEEVAARMEKLLKVPGLGAVEELNRALSDRWYEVIQLPTAKLLGRFPELVRLTVPQLPTTEAFDSILERLGEFQFPRVSIDPALVVAVREAAEASLEHLPEDDREVLEDFVSSLEEVEEGLDEEAPGEPAKRGFDLLIIALLSLLFQFLASQDKIIENGFRDAATIGAALTHVWQYALILLLYLLARKAARGQ